MLKFLMVGSFFGWIGSTCAISLVPSSLYSLSLRPTFLSIDLISKDTLTSVMETIILDTVETLYRESLIPTHLDVVLQSTADETWESEGIQLPTTTFEFAVLATFREYTAATGAKFVDAVVHQALLRVSSNQVLVGKLNESDLGPLTQVMGATVNMIAKNDRELPGAASEGPTTRYHYLTLADVILISISSLVFAGIVLVCIQSRTIERLYANRVASYSSPAAREELENSHSPRNLFGDKSASLPENFPDPGFKIMKYNPLDTGGTCGTSTPPAKAVSPESPGNPTTPCDSEMIVDDTSMPEQFSSGFFREADQISFSVDSDEVFGVGSLKNSKECVESNNFNASVSRLDWSKSIRVIPSDSRSPSTGSNPQSVTNKGDILVPETDSCTHIAESSGASNGVVELSSSTSFCAWSTEPAHDLP